MPARKATAKAAKPTTVPVIIYGPNLGVDGPALHVHAPSCADLKKRVYAKAQEEPWTLEITTVKDLVDDVYPQGDFGYEPEEWEDYVGEFKIFPCVTLPGEEPTEPAAKPAAKPAQTDAKPRSRKLSGATTRKAAKAASLAEEKPLADKLRALREGGESWWHAAYLLGLPGSADNVAQGKGGAAHARALWERHFGPRPKVEPKPKKEENTTTPGAKEARKAAVKRGESFFAAETPDIEIINQIIGHKITWYANLNNLDGKGDKFLELEARVHREGVRIEEGVDDRVLHFREWLGMKDGRPVCGPHRTVRLSAIHTVER